MLVLTREKDEEVVINGNIVVTVVAIHGSKVRLGITAPEGIAVNRREIQDLVDRGLVPQNGGQ